MNGLLYFSDSVLQRLAFFASFLLLKVPDKSIHQGELLLSFSPRKSSRLLAKTNQSPRKEKPSASIPTSISSNASSSTASNERLESGKVGDDLTNDYAEEEDDSEDSSSDDDSSENELSDHENDELSDHEQVENLIQIWIISKFFSVCRYSLLNIHYLMQEKLIKSSTHETSSSRPGLSTSTPALPAPSASTSLRPVRATSTLPSPAQSKQTSASDQKTVESSSILAGSSTSHYEAEVAIVKEQSENKIHSEEQGERGLREQGERELNNRRRRFKRIDTSLIKVYNIERIYSFQ